MNHSEGLQPLENLGPDFAKPDYKPKDYSDYVVDEQKLVAGESNSNAFPLENPSKSPEDMGEQEEKEKLPDGLINTTDLAKTLKPEDLDVIYGWYSNAMQRRDREPLSADGFVYHFFGGGSWEPTYAVGNIDTGFILGFYKHDIFIPTHFAPKTMKGGYALFKELADNKEMPVATAVTDDLAETLMKMDGWHKLKVSLLSYFNSDLKKKVIVYNSAQGVRMKIIGLLKEFWEETKQLKKQQESV